MREYNFRVMKNIWIRKVKSQIQSINIDPTLTFYKIREEKGEIILWKLYFKKL